MSKNINALISKINKKYKRSIISRASEAKGLVIHKVQTGSIALDIALNGGLALGRLSQISGQFSSGKSVLCSLIGKAFQEGRISPPIVGDRERLVVYLDLEGTFDAQWAAFLGVDPEKFIVANPVGGEETWDLVSDIMDEAQSESSDMQSLIFVDSLSAAFPMSESSSDLTDDAVQPGLHARLTGRGIKKFLPRLRRELDSDSPDSTVVFVNQVRIDIMKRYGDPEVETGGKAPGFFSSQIIKIRRGESIKRDAVGKPIVGYVMKFSIKKDKTGGQDQTTGEARFYKDPDPELGIAGGCFDNAYDIISIADGLGVLERNGAVYRFGNVVIGKGKDNLAAKLRKDEALYGEIEELSLAKSKSMREEGRNACKEQEAESNDEEPESGEGDSEEG